MKRSILTKRRILFAGLSLLGASGGYVALLCFPDPFFAYALIHGSIILRSDEPIPASTRSVLDEAERRLAGSPLNQPATKNHIYICNRPWRFLVFANFRHHVGGLMYPPLSNNIYLRAVHFDVNRLVGPSGNEVSGERTLSYFVTHEIAHTLIADRLGASTTGGSPTGRMRDMRTISPKGQASRTRMPFANFGQATGRCIPIVRGCTCGITCSSPTFFSEDASAWTSCSNKTSIHAKSNGS